MSVVQYETSMGRKALINGIEFDVCPKCGKPIRGTGRTAPGFAAFVVKKYVKNKQIEDFPHKWARLCEASGFEVVEWIRAWVIESKGVQIDLWGNPIEKVVERVSFFRRLHQTKMRAKRLFDGLSRDEKAKWLWKAHAKKWASAGVVRKSTIYSEAEMMAWKDAGSPRVDIDTEINYEEVIICRRKKNC